jgi:hypothetical protein
VTLEDFCAALSFRDLPEVRSGPPLAVAAGRLARIAFPSRAYEDFYTGLLREELAALDDGVPPPTVAELTRAIVIDFASRTCWMNGAVVSLRPGSGIERRAALLSTERRGEALPDAGLWVLYGRYESFVRSVDVAALPGDAFLGPAGLEEVLRELARPGHTLRCVALGPAVEVGEADALLAAVTAGYGRVPELVLASGGLPAAPGLHLELAAEVAPPGGRLAVLRCRED